MQETRYALSSLLNLKSSSTIQTTEKKIELWKFAPETN